MIPTQADDGGTIDITNLVESMRSLFVKSGRDYLMGLALLIPGAGPVAHWFMKALLTPLVDWLLGQLSKWMVMEAFFINTAIRKPDQARDFVSAIDFKKSLPPTATDAEYEQAEKNEMAAFNRLVVLTK